ncbi:MAG: 5'/3'-nucleotidase SurE [Dehalococcoidales bacterium]
MKILVTNDDGIFTPGLWTLAKELNSIARVFVVAPDREQSATGTAITLRQPLRVQKITPMVPGVEAYSVEGTPSDSVILALGRLLKDRIDMVISGINQGPNLGDDVLLSGTVGAALQGYLRGLPAFAISIAAANSANLSNAARLAVLLAKRIHSSTRATDVFLNVNLPDLPLAEIKGLTITQPAHKSHIDTVEKGHDGRQEYYWLIRQKLGTDVAEATDIWALEQGNISITALHTTLFQKPLPAITNSLCSGLFQELKQS